ncbi:hypothetical protein METBISCDRAFT_19045 [Metschnikowia bicuspidata]|uniref:Transcription initiation factor IIA large subunit n=1 Tax=Metschnikowia bicuspidata TaxID=27322 RepID=A0A4P9ZAD5_9ASCO|nr:hypothetical protein METBISCDRAFT_19045 [Metschnikowia bicuspidata]
MSNYEAGKLYEAVVEEVIADSRQDFEDSGIDESTLQELRRLWCERLSQTKVCHFSWNEVHHELAHPSNPDMLPGMDHQGDTLQLHKELEIPNMNNYSASLTHTNLAANGFGTGIELPAIKQEYEDTGLIIPKIELSDGALELSVELSLADARAHMARLKQSVRAQTDGANDELGADYNIFNDSDDINLDLDDDLDSEKTDEEAEQEGQIMLCLYDKVQRVKNKWKCTLKEGIANIYGRDYVFQRATGESEW